MSVNTRILVIGGGYAGARTVQELSKKGFTDVTLVDRKDYFEVTYATLRGITEPDNWGKRSRVAYDDFIRGRFVQGAVAELSQNTALLTSGEVLSFDYAVVATGSSYTTFPIAKSEKALNLSARESEFTALHKKLALAKSVLIVGGGPVGVEFAGEVVSCFPDKKVSLVHGGDCLLNGFSEIAGKTAKKQLESLGVNVQLNTSLKKMEGGRYKSKTTGKEYQADIVYLCAGAKPNTSMMRTHFSNALDENNRLDVDANLRIRHTNHIFAMGDCANVDELKLGFLADKQGVAVAENIYRLLTNKNLKPYKTNPKMALVPTGRKSGLLQLPFAVTTLRCLVNVKQKDLFISKSFKALDVAKDKKQLIINPGL